MAPGRKPCNHTALNHVPNYQYVVFLPSSKNTPSQEKEQTALADLKALLQLRATTTGTLHWVCTYFGKPDPQTGLYHQNMTCASEAASVKEK